MIWLDVCTCSMWRSQLLSPDWFFHRDVRCLFEVGISMVIHVCAGRFTRPCIVHTEFWRIVRTFCLWEVLLVEYDNVVLHRLPIFRLPFTYWMTLRRLPRTSDQIHPGYTSGKNKMAEKSVLHLLWYTNKNRIFKRYIS
jgi:hypothetical protein